MKIITMHSTASRRVGVGVVAALAAAILTGCGGMDHDMNGPGTGQPSGATFNAADVRFATDMVPHHRQAVEMAAVAETRGSNAQLKTLAAAIRTAQDPEIETMTRWLSAWGQPVPSTGPHGGHGGMPSGTASDMPGMMSEQEMRHLQAAAGKDFDRMFLDMMIRHHQGAVEMSATEQRSGMNPEAKQLAAAIAAAQTTEITQMRDLLAKL